MRRIKYNGEEYLIHTRSGLRVLDVMRDHGIGAGCDCDGVQHSTEQCTVQWPKDTAFLLTAPTDFERKVLGDKLNQGYRLACQAIFK
ncbi:MAG: hypothetical protein ACOY93_09705 [Bacillota bacterium]